MTKQEFNDYPIKEVLKEAIHKAKTVGGYFHQKWTCKHCGSRQTMEQKNQFFHSGKCEECGEVSLIRRCNYLFIIPQSVTIVKGNKEQPK